MPRCGYDHFKASKDRKGVSMFCAWGCRWSSSVVLFLLHVLLTLSPLHAIPTTFSVRVVGVIDGDTITVLLDGKEEKVRLYGIDCPEDGQAFGRRAKQFTSDKTFGRDVVIKPRDKDPYGRIVAEVFLSDNTLLNEALISAGLAWWYQRYAPRGENLRDLERQARKEKIAIWSQPDPVPPWEYRQNQVEARSNKKLKRRSIGGGR